MFVSILLFFISEFLVIYIVIVFDETHIFLSSLPIAFALFFAWKFILDFLSFLVFWMYICVELLSNWTMTFKLSEAVKAIRNFMDKRNSC